MENKIDDESVEKAVYFSSAVPLIFILLIGLFFTVKVVGHELDRPQACSPDGGKTISYFIAPTLDNKGIAIVKPGEMRYYELKSEGEYDLVHIAPNEVRKILIEESKKSQ